MRDYPVFLRNTRIMKIYWLIWLLFVSVVVLLFSGECFKAVFHFKHIVAKHTAYSLLLQHSGRTNDMDTQEYTRFRYDMVKVGNRLYLNFIYAE